MFGSFEDLLQQFVARLLDERDIGFNFSGSVPEGPRTQIIGF